MANKTVAQLATLSGVAANDLFPVYDTSETGIEKLKHITTADLKTEMQGGLTEVGHVHQETDIEDLDKYTQSEIMTISGVLQSAIDTKSDSGHNHDARYYTESEVDALTWTEDDITDLDKYTQAEVDSAISTTSGVLQTAIDGKATTGHDHNDIYFTETELTTGGALDGRYYTENEVGSLLAGKSDTTHTHVDIYYAGNKVLETFEESTIRGVKITDADGDQVVFYKDSNGDAIISNREHGANIGIGAEDEDGNHHHGVSIDPDGSTYLYYDGDIKCNTIYNGVSVTGHILPEMTGASGVVSTRNIGSPTQKFNALYVHDAYIDASSLYVNEKKVIEDDMNTIVISTDPDQAVRVKTTGAGNIYLEPGDELDVTAAGGVEVVVPSTNPTKHVNFTNQSTNGNITFSAAGTGGSVQFSADDDIDFTSTGGTINLNGTVDLGSATVDHGALSGRGDDDHTQYHTDARGDARYLKLTGGNVSGNVTIAGNFTVSGTTTTVDAANLQVTDKVITVNDGEAGAGLTGGSVAGMRVDRGSETDYRFVFDETQDNFRVGEVGSEQAVATREDSPTNGNIPYWDSTAVMFKTDSGLDYSQVPQLDETNTWTAANTFTSNVNINMNNPFIQMQDTNGAVDAKYARIYWYENGFLVRSVNDDFSTKTNLLEVKETELLYKSNRVLTTADEGTGNGLDADTLDGQEATAFAAAVHNHDGSYYTETELDAGQLDNRYYTETEVDSALSGKSDTSHTHDGYLVNDADDEIDGRLTMEKLRLKNASAQLSGEFEVGNTPAGVNPAMYNGYFYATKVYNAVWNDIADFQPLMEGTDYVAGKCYFDTLEGAAMCNQRCQKSVIGILSDTFGFGVGDREGDQAAPFAVAGWALAYVMGSNLEPGDVLTNDEEGNLVKMNQQEKSMYPERIVAIYKKPEPSETWGPEGSEIQVNGRHWVKIK